VIAGFELVPETVFGKTFFEVFLKFVQYQFSRLYHYICIYNFTNMFCIIPLTITLQEYRGLEKRITKGFTVFHHRFL